MLFLVSGFFRIEIPITFTPKIVPLRASCLKTCLHSSLLSLSLIDTAYRYDRQSRLYSYALTDKYTIPSDCSVTGDHRCQGQNLGVQTASMIEVGIILTYPNPLRNGLRGSYRFDQFWFKRSLCLCGKTPKNSALKHEDWPRKKIEWAKKRHKGAEVCLNNLDGKSDLFMVGALGFNFLARFGNVKLQPSELSPFSERFI